MASDRCERPGLGEHAGQAAGDLSRARQRAGLSLSERRPPSGPYSSPTKRARVALREWCYSDLLPLKEGGAPPTDPQGHLKGFSQSFWISPCLLMALVLFFSRFLSDIYKVSRV